MDRLLIHACCGPCSIVPFRLLGNEGVAATAFFFNPNIQPDTEYTKRLEAFDSFAASMGIPVVHESEQTLEWADALRDYGGIFPLITGDTLFEENRRRRQQRCTACYRFRFEKLARYARDRGYTAISTTLSISPYQFIDILKEQLQQAAATQGIQSNFMDYRAWYSEATNLSRQRGMYRQNYCGCVYSLEEAQLEREARKRLRKASMVTSNDSDPKGIS